MRRFFECWKSHFSPTLEKNYICFNHANTSTLYPKRTNKGPQAHLKEGGDLLRLQCGQTSKLRKPKNLHRKQLLKYGSCTALPTLRLLGIMVATKCANFSLIDPRQGASFWGCFFRQIAAPPVYAPKSFWPPFGSARFGAVQTMIFGLY